MRRELTVARRFRGPPDSGNGGYVCGRLAAEASNVLGREVGRHEAWSVRLLRPPPLDVPMQLRVARQGDHDVLQLHCDEQEVAEGTQAANLAAPALPAELVAMTPELAAACRSRYAGGRTPEFRGCFVCGIDRQAGDGLRVFAGPLADRDDRVVSPWIPDASLDDGTGHCAREFMWAALDCPGAFAAVPEGGIFLLAEMTAWVLRPAQIGEVCTAVGWSMDERIGRKRLAGTAILDAGGEPIAVAQQLWIQPRSMSVPPAVPPAAP